jgi:uncharacterized protein YndB with AHSA1/START domain
MAEMTPDELKRKEEVRAAYRRLGRIFVWSGWVVAFGALWLGGHIITKLSSRVMELENDKRSGAGQSDMPREGAMTFPAQHISVSIERPAQEVYDFASDPANLPKWASGLGGSIKKVGGDWVADSPMGQVKVKFADRNPFGVLDHAVTLPSGEVFDNPMRVVANEKGSEVTFTLYRRPGVTDPQLAADAATVLKDLRALKELLEKS